MDRKPVIKSTIFRFNSLPAAKSFTDRCEKIMMTLLGDDGLFWVVSPADARRLENAGYELA